MTFNVGRVATLTYTLTVADVLTDATVTLTITAPDGTSTTPGPTHAGTGTYTADILITQAGTWTYRWAASGAATDVETGTFRAAVADPTSPTVEQLRAFLNLATIDETRGQLMLELAQQACEIYVTPLPDTAKALVLTVAGRAYSNPQAVTAETIGPYSVQRPAAGIYLTRSERATLRILSGHGGAFSIDPTPADAGTGLPSHDLNITWPDGIPLLDQPSTS